jgi:hypothetical protein
MQSSVLIVKLPGKWNCSVLVSNLFELELRSSLLVRARVSKKESFSVLPLHLLLLASYICSTEGADQR